jgi:hypothetical protein
MNFFRKHFTAHEGNDFRPHPMRENTLLGLGSVALALFLVVLTSQMALRDSSLTALVLPRVLVDAANKDREIQNVTGLSFNSQLERAAQLKADDMAGKSYFSHTSPDGMTPWYWFDQVGYNYKYAGENLAIDFSESADVEIAWMNSPEHRANILNGNYSEIGIATAPGYYNGVPTTFVVELFGRPALAGNWTFPLNEPALATALQTPPEPPSTPTSKEKGSLGTRPTQTVQEVSDGTKVLGEQSTAKDTYIGVEKVNAIAAPAVVAPKGAYSAPIERAIFSSGKLLSIAYAIISFLILLGLIGLIFSEMKKHHLRQVVLSLVVLALMSSLLYLYHTVLFGPLILA